MIFEAYPVQDARITSGRFAIWLLLPNKALQSDKVPATQSLCRLTTCLTTP